MNFRVKVMPKGVGEGCSSMPSGIWLIPATTPSELLEVCERLRRSDCTGCRDKRGMLTRRLCALQ
jgi:hypothetical protein